MSGEENQEETTKEGRVRKEYVSEAVIRRLPRYYHCLKNLEREGIPRVSSITLAERLNITPSQVRQDFSNFGGFGHQGYGYEVEYLKSKIAAELGLDRTYNVVVIGGGNIGRALTGYTGFKREGFHITAVFDIAPEKVSIRKEIPVYDVSELEKYVGEHQIDICVIATNAESAKSVAEYAVKCGLRALWNFAPIELYLGDDIAIENISMSESLFYLSYCLNALDKPRKQKKERIQK